VGSDADYDTCAPGKSVPPDRDNAKHRCGPQVVPTAHSGHSPDSGRKSPCRWSEQPDHVAWAACALPATISVGRFRSTYKSRSVHPTLDRGSNVSWRSRRWWTDKSSKAAGQVFGPDRPHKSLHVLGRRKRTKTLVIGLEAARRSDMPSKPVCGRELAGGFDSRPPPLLKWPLTSDLSPRRVRGGCGKGLEPRAGRCSRRSADGRVWPA